MSRVEIETISRTFGTNRALDELSLTVEDGEFVVLLGPSGCGKTTALRSIAGLEHPDLGSIRIGGREVVNPEVGVLVPANRRDIGMVFQSYALWPHMSVAQNIAYPLKARGRGGEARARVAGILEVVGLEHHADRYPSELSGGQQQRVALARALVADPALVLFDEPLSNLDAQLRTRLRNEIRRIHRHRQRTSLYVTHDQAEALTLADRIVLLNHGRIEQIGTPGEIFLKPRNRFVAEFVGIGNFLSGVVTGASAQGARFRPDGWLRDLHIASPPPPSGTRATAAFRTSSASVTAGGAGESANAVEGRLTDVSYTGDRFEAEIEVAGTAITASITLGDGGAASLAERGRPVSIRIPPTEILLLSEHDPETAPKALAAE
ncbi:ABC transporter ATP-binding protein [Rhizobium sp. P007]|jgi:iron(III) transport system ATP-binding protein|uniref:ABC transporter ATP-binding protein n=1 Tax=Rhizobium sp. P007 TaxID=285908 RepID=UPI0011570D69|nr:ABC transporter ATP-binding protein [Rhizobium sp. P007]CAD7045406.1 spermidine/putrescine ABC transporter ATP-binding protein [Rhizobium sp. P007]